MCMTGSTASALVCRTTNYRASCKMSDTITLKSAHNRAVYEWWRSSHDGGALPRNAVLSTLGKYLASCVVLAVKRDPDDFHYRFAGTRIDEFTHQSLTGLSMSAIDAQKPPSAIWSACCTVRDERRLVSGMVPYVGPRKDFVHMEDIILPFSNDGKQVTALVASVDYFRSDDDSHRI